VDPEKWERVKALFQSALERAPTEREGFLAQASGGDRSLRAEVESLLASHQNAHHFVGILSQPLAANSPAPEIQDPLIGRLIGSYRVVRQIGRGGMAIVYLGVRADDQYRKQVAIKLVLPGFDTKEVLRRFRNERQTLAGLDHPNIVRLLDGGNTDQGLPYLVMDYVDGVPIDHYCDLHRLPTTERLQLFRQVCAAVTYAHLNLVIHRDLKPSNILVTAEGVPKLLDFGIAKLLNPELARTLLITQTNLRLMTPEYASPEQIRGESITPATDVYSLGVILYELLTGHRPYRLKLRTPLEVEKAICEAEPRKPSTAVTCSEEIADPDASTVTTITPEQVSRTRDGDTQKLRRRLVGDLDVIVLKALCKEPQRRYASVHDFSEDIRRHLEHLPITARPSKFTYQASKFLRRHKEAVIPTGIALALFAGLALLLSHSTRPPLAGGNEILLTDFVNSTGDSVFDNTLGQGLAAQLEQSPYLRLASEKRIQQTLRLMGQPADARMTGPFARDVCQRMHSAAVLEGSITSIESEYVIGLNAINCRTGDILAREQVTSEDKKHVLAVLGQAATSIRKKLGESLSTVEKFDTPIEQATTSSLEALKAYSLGKKARREKGDAEAIPFFKRAIELDPNFAMAYAVLGLAYANLGQAELASANSSKAFDLRGRVSEHEKLNISAAYHGFVTEELDKEIGVYQVWTQNYPDDESPRSNLGAGYGYLGQWDKALAEFKEALRLEPDDVVAYGDLAACYLALNQPAEAKRVIEQALGRKLDNWGLRLYMYFLAFQRADMPEMEGQVAWATGKPGDEDILFSAQSDTEAYYGWLRKARESSVRAAESARRADENETAATYSAKNALWEAEFGNATKARQAARAALALAPGRYVRVLAALSLARAGDTKNARKLSDELARAYPTNTILNLYWLPTVRAAIELNRGKAERALELLGTAVPYELGWPPPLQTGTLYPIYLRGQAYLAAHQGSEAVAELRKILEHRGIVLNFPTAALARLQLGRAYALSGDPAKARSAYQDFLTLWKNAEPNIPILKQAEAEYAKLQ
jgi:serine/threonine protein kinase/tetratricopeptide (TPR) repeat protein